MMQRKKLRRMADLGLHILGKFGNQSEMELWYVCLAGAQVKRGLIGPKKYLQPQKVPGLSRLSHLLGGVLQELFAGDRNERCSCWK